MLVWQLMKLAGENRGSREKLGWNLEELHLMARLKKDRLAVRRGKRKSRRVCCPRSKEN